MRLPAAPDQQTPLPWRPVVRWLVVCGLLVLLLQSLGMALQLPSQRGTGYPLTTQLFQLTWAADWQGLVPRLVTLERAAILPFWQASDGMRFIASLWFALDAALFVPAYVALLLALCRLCSAVLQERTPQRVLQAAQRAPWVAAGFDQLENSLSLIAINRTQSDPGRVLDAMLTLAAHVKWFALAVGAGALVWLCMEWLRALGWRRVGDELLALARLLANSARLVFLHTYAFIALVAGVLLVGYVPQVNDILINLALESASDPAEQRMRELNLLWLTAGVVLWGASLWYSMRMVAPWTPQGVVHDNVWHLWARRDLPRLAAYFGVVSVATLCALSMSARGSLASALFMGLGAAIMFEAVSSLCSWVANRILLFKDNYRSDGARYRYSALMVCVAAALVAWLSVDQFAAPVISGLGWYQPPDRVWRWRAANVDPAALALLALLAAALIAYVLVTRVRRGPLWHVLLNAAALACWWTAAAITDAHYAMLIFGGVLLLAALGLWFVAERRHFNWTLLRKLYRLLLEQQPFVYRLLATRPQVTLWVLLLIGALVVVMTFSVAPLALGWSMGTLGIGFLALSLWCFVFTFLWIYLPQRFGVGNWAIAPLLLLLLVGQPAERALRTAPIEQQALPTLPTLHQHHANWRQGLPDAQSPVFLVAAAGGGLRAAYWTGGLLAAMDDRTCGRFGDHIFAVSGVSGGSVGLSAYLAQRKVWAAKPEAERCQGGRVEELQRFLRRDYLGPVAGSLLFAEVAQAFIPFSYLRMERGTTLADAMAHGWRDTFRGAGADLLERPFLDVMSVRPDDSFRMPAVYLNATTVESGKRAVAANVQLGAMRADPLFFEANVSRGTRLQTTDLSLVDAAVNSARFPGISPPGKVMGCFPMPGHVAGTEDACRDAGFGVWGHLVDGGFFENSGLETLMDAWRELIDQMHGRNNALADAERRRTFLIVITNDKDSGAVCPGRTPRFDLLGMTDGERYAINSLNALSQSAQPSNGADAAAIGSDLLAPMHTLASVRSGRADLALQRAVDAIGCTQVIEWHLSAVMTHPQEQPKEPPLGWLLSMSSAQVMDRAVKVFADHFPFDLAACPRVTPRGRGQIGKSDDPLPASGCKQPPPPPGPLRPGRP